MERFRTYAMLAKPVSSQCNFRCEYCYYQGKAAQLGQRKPIMSRDTLEQFVKQNIDMHGKEAFISFAWHGGEPLMAGLDFYRDALALQRQYGADRQIQNSIQTNGALLNDDWCAFFRENQFEIGVSIDGPKELHNTYRKRVDGTGTFDDTMRGIRLLQRHRIPFSALTTVNRVNMAAPLQVYEFLRELTDYIQFLPVVERLAAAPGALAPFSVTPEGYGSFLCAVWDAWKNRDAGKIHIQMFDVTSANLRGVASSLCVHHPVCGHSGSVEVNGDVYACDRFAFPGFKLGNLHEHPLSELMERNRPFGMHKAYGMDNGCFDCPYLKLCFGGCPKDRLDGKKNVLCAGYRKFFSHVVGDGTR